MKNEKISATYDCGSRGAMQRVVGGKSILRRHGYWLSNSNHSFDYGIWVALTGGSGMAGRYDSITQSWR